MRGRKSTPTALRILHGNPRQKAIPKGEPMPATRLVDPPAWFSEGQRDVWAEALRRAPPGMLRRIDGNALAAWTVSCDLFRLASILQATLPLLVKAPITGAAIQSPLLAIINRQSVIMAKWASELGFTPVSRPRINISAAPIEPRVIADPGTKPRGMKHIPLAEYIAAAPHRRPLN